jgi:hypothetical protein
VGEQLIEQIDYGYDAKAKRISEATFRQVQGAPTTTIAGKLCPTGAWLRTADMDVVIDVQRHKREMLVVEAMRAM